jgi:hypothetical protein
MSGVPLLVLLLLAAEEKPAPKFPLGKETTYVTGPLDKEGYIDYETALNERLGKGITPQKNSNVLIWKALGPRPEGNEVPAEVFKWLGIEALPADAYFVSLQAYMKDHLKLEREVWDAIFDQQARATQRPWAAKDYPFIAGWLKVNERPLALVIEATRLPDYFNPVVTPKTGKGPTSLIGGLLPAVQKCREITTALSARALLRTAEGKADDAWQDLLACHRLGRLVARGATLIEALVGIALDHVASNAELAYLEGARLTPRQVRACLRDLQGLPPMPPMADKIALGERFMFLDSVQLVRRGGIGMLEGLAGGTVPERSDPEALKALEKFDWDGVLRNGNRWYDRMAAALRVKDRPRREKQLDRIEEELKALKKEAGSPAKLLKIILAGEPDKAAGKAISDVLIGLLMPAVRKVQSAADRSEQVQANLHVAFALAAYRGENGRFPAKLEELAPKYLAAVPGDLFSGKALIYQPSAEGYLLYSVGVNGRDEAGHWYDDAPPGDDPRVRMPLPPLKPKR